VSQKPDLHLVAVTSSNLNRFYKFLIYGTAQNSKKPYIIPIPTSNLKHVAELGGEVKS